MTHKRWGPRLQLRQNVYLFLHVNSMLTSSIHVMPDNNLISNILQNRYWHRRLLCITAKHSNNHNYCQCFVARYRTTARK